MFVFIGTKIALPGMQLSPDSEFYYWVDNDEDYLSDKDGNYFIGEYKKIEEAE